MSRGANKWTLKATLCLRTAKEWKVKDGSLKQTFEGHSHWVLAVCIPASASSPEFEFTDTPPPPLLSRALFTGSADCRIKQ